jgi:hypothetical protein
MSRASLREVAQATLGAWAAGLRKVLNIPFIKVAIPVCSERSLGGQGVEPDPRGGGGKAEDIDQLRPVPGLARQRPQLVRDAHASLQDRVEVVLLQQLGAAGRQHVRVHVPAGQLRPQVVGPLRASPTVLAARTVTTLPSSRTSNPLSSSRSFTRARAADQASEIAA